MPEVAKTILLSTVTQLVGVLGIFFVFGYILSKLQRWTSANYQRSIGWKGVLWTAWIGTPIHELAHVFFCWLFRHRVDEISLFSPDRESGKLGHVNHSYDKLSLYQRMGGFFVGAAPMIIGPIILTGLLYWLVPNAKVIFNPLIDTFSSVNAFKDSLLGVSKLFIKENLQHWQFWVFLYVSLCIASHMAPSRADLRGMWKGLLWIVLLVIGINILALVLEFPLTEYVLRVSQYFGIFTAIFVYATVLSIIHLIFSRIVFAIFSKDWMLGS
jgi:hypothetical protein